MMANACWALSDRVEIETSVASGPAPAPIARIKGKTRWQLVLKGPTHAALAGPLDAIEQALADLPSSVRVAIDVDPGAML